MSIDLGVSEYLTLKTVHRIQNIWAEFAVQISGFNSSRLGKTMPLSGHSSIGSIRTLTQLPSGVPPPTTESNKGGSVPVISQKPGMAFTSEYTQNITLQYQVKDPKDKPTTPYLQH
ncbi:hypothetical protein TNCV_4787901 [Trichonephila clavipes]|nr:hypothetical protein TNCV_4787901 [Trichonephila clavipes]